MTPAFEKVTALRACDRDRIEFALATGKPVDSQDIRLLLLAIDQLGDALEQRLDEQEAPECACAPELAGLRRETARLRKELEEHVSWGDRMHATLYELDALRHSYPG